MSIKLVKTQNIYEIGTYVVNLIKNDLFYKRTLNVGINSNFALMPIYQELTNYFLREPNNANLINIFALEEFKEIGSHDPNSIRTFLENSLIHPSNFQTDNFYSPTTLLPEKDEFYDHLIFNKGKLDVAILVLGVNGELGYCSHFQKVNDYSGEQNLSPYQMNELRRIIPSNYLIPNRIFSIGIGALNNADKLIVIANDLSKLVVVRKILSYANNIPSNGNFAASILAKHPNVSLILGPELSFIL